MNSKSLNRSATPNDYRLLAVYLADLRDWLAKEQGLEQIAELTNGFLLNALAMRDTAELEAATLEARVLYLVPPIQNN
jgi:hypothetical protein